MAGKVIGWGTEWEQNELEVLLKPETSDGVVGVVCEKRVGWEFTLRASEMQVGLEGLVWLDW